MIYKTQNLQNAWKARDDTNLRIHTYSIDV